MTKALLFACICLALSWLGAGCGGDHHDGEAWSQADLDELERKWGFEVSLFPSPRTPTPRETYPSNDSDGPRLTTRQWKFNGIGSFAHLKHVKCLTTPSELYDIAIIGAPFDTAVSYRPGKCPLPAHPIFGPLSNCPRGARFGPRAIRQASARQSSMEGFNPRAGINPYRSWASIIDCGDIPITPMDNAIALQQMTEAFRELARRKPLSSTLERPRLITLGGDHSLALPALRALKEVYGPLRVLHFDGKPAYEIQP